MPYNALKISYNPLYMQYHPLEMLYDPVKMRYHRPQMHYNPLKFRYIPLKLRYDPLKWYYSPQKKWPYTQVLREPLRRMDPDALLLAATLILTAELPMDQKNLTAAKQYLDSASKFGEEKFDETETPNPKKKIKYLRAKLE